MLRGADFSQSDVDVRVADLPELKVDAKYRKAHSHHRLMDELKEKYCLSEYDVPVLVTKEHRQQGCHVTIPGWFFEKLLTLYRQSSYQPSADAPTPE